MLYSLYTRGVILRELAPCYGTHEGANERNLLWDSWYSLDEGLETSLKLNMATSLWSRSKQKKLILLMMMMLEDDSSVSKKVARKTWARLWLLRRQAKGAFYTIFRELSLEDSDGFCEYIRTPYAKFELINFYTFSRRHVDFWARVKGSKGIVDENIGLFDWLMFYICRTNPKCQYTRGSVFKFAQFATGACSQISLTG